MAHLRGDFLMISHGDRVATLMAIRISAIDHVEDQPARSEGPRVEINGNLCSGTFEEVMGLLELHRSQAREIQL